MNVNYDDGRREMFRNMTQEQIQDELKSAMARDGFNSAEVWDMDKPSGPYPNNRAGRRRWAAELRKGGKL